jgi:hypothetical protein
MTTLFELFGDPKMIDSTIEKAIKEAAFAGLTDERGEQLDGDPWSDCPIGAMMRDSLVSDLQEATRISFQLAGQVANTPAEKREVWMFLLGLLCESAQAFGLVGTVHGVALKFDEIDPRAQASMIESAAAQLEQDPDSEEVQDYVRRQFYSMTVDTVGLLADPATKEGLAEVLHRGISVFLQRHLRPVEPEPLPNECKILGPDGQPAAQ